MKPSAGSKVVMAQICNCTTGKAGYYGLEVRNTVRRLWRK